MSKTPNQDSDFSSDDDSEGGGVCLDGKLSSQQEHRKEETVRPDEKYSGTFDDLAKTLYYEFKNLANNFPIDPDSRPAGKQTADLEALGDKFRTEAEKLSSFLSFPLPLPPFSPLTNNSPSPHPLLQSNKPAKPTPSTPKPTTSAPHPPLHRPPHPPLHSNNPLPSNSASASSTTPPKQPTTRLTPTNTRTLPTTTTICAGWAGSRSMSRSDVWCWAGCWWRSGLRRGLMLVGGCGRGWRRRGRGGGWIEGVRRGEGGEIDGWEGGGLGGRGFGWL